MTRLRRSLLRAIAVGAIYAGPAVALAVDLPLPGKIGIVKRDKKNPSVGKLAKFTSKAPKGGPLFSIPAPGSGDDPTLVGASFQVREYPPDVGGTIPLPAAGWKGLGKPPGSKGFKYKGAGTVDDPCKVVILKEKVIRATCKGPGAVPPLFTIPVVGFSVWYILDVGSRTYCTIFYEPFVKNDGVKQIWKDKNAPPPGVCSTPLPSPSPPPSPTPTPALTPPPLTPTPSYGSASQAFLIAPASLLQ